MIKRNKNTQQAWNQNLNRFLSQTADGIYAIDHNHRIVFWNKTCEHIFGVVSRYAMGNPCYEVVGGKDCYGNPVCFPNCMVFTAARQGRLVENFEMQIPRREDPVCVNVSTIFIQDSQPPAIVHLVRETSDSHRIGDHLQQILLHLEKLPMPEKASPTPKATPSLSQREREVLFCLSCGKHAKNIAHELCVSPSTIRSHIKNILCKLEVHSQLEAIAYAYQHKLF